MSLLSLIFILMVFSEFAVPVHASQTLFYDNFGGTTLPLWNQWGVVGGGGGGFALEGSAIASAGWMIVSSTSPSVCPLNTVCTTPLIANVTSPITNSSTPNGQFIQEIIRSQPFNVTKTSPGSAGLGAAAQLDFGLANFNKGHNYPSSYILIGVTEGAASNGQNNNQKSSIVFRIVHPGTGVNNCMDSSTIGFSFTSCNYPLISYGNPNYPINVYSVHTFVFQMRFYPSSGGNSWVAISIDNSAFLNLTNTECSCLTSPGGVMNSMYPFIYQSYTNYAQTVGSYVNYVFITDYPVAAIVSTPTTQSPVHAPGSNPGSPFGTGGQLPGISFGGTTDIVTWFQYMASSLGGGNIYIGGTEMTLMFIIAAIATEYKFGLGISFIYAATIIGIGTMMFAFGLLQIYVAAFFWMLGIVALVGAFPSNSNGVHPNAI